MLLQELIDENLMNVDLKAKVKDAVIEGMVDLLLKEGIISNKQEFIDVIKKRESIESTAIGDGIAIPHGRAPQVERLSVAFTRSKKGVDFSSLDKKPVHLIFMIAAPQEARKEYLQAVAKIARLLKSNVMKERLLKADTPSKVMDILKEFDHAAPGELLIETKEGRVIYKKGKK
jgi:fructose-specific phosphotransferase system IIA component